MARHTSLLIVCGFGLAACAPERVPTQPPANDQLVKPIELAPAAVEAPLGASPASLYHCSPFDTVSSAEALMRAKRVRRLPVLDGEGALLRVLSLADTAKATARAGSTALDPGKLTLTLASICQSWQGEAQPSN